MLAAFLGEINSSAKSRPAVPGAHLHEGKRVAAPVIGASRHDIDLAGVGLPVAGQYRAALAQQVARRSLLALLVLSRGGLHATTSSSSASSSASASNWPSMAALIGAKRLPVDGRYAQ